MVFLCPQCGWDILGPQYPGVTLIGYHASSQNLSYCPGDRQLQFLDLGSCSSVDLLSEVSVSYNQPGSKNIWEIPEGNNSYVLNSFHCRAVLRCYVTAVRIANLLLGLLCLPNFPMDVCLQDMSQPRGLVLPGAAASKCLECRGDPMHEVSTFVGSPHSLVQTHRGTAILLLHSGHLQLVLSVARCCESPLCPRLVRPILSKLEELQTLSWLQLSYLG